MSTSSVIVPAPQFSFAISVLCLIRNANLCFSIQSIGIDLMKSQAIVIYGQVAANYSFSHPVPGSQWLNVWTCAIIFTRTGAIFRTCPYSLLPGNLRLQPGIRYEKKATFKNTKIQLCVNYCYLFVLFFVKVFYFILYKF